MSVPSALTLRGVGDSSSTRAASLRLSYFYDTSFRALIAGMSGVGTHSGGVCGSSPT